MFWKIYNEKYLSNWNKWNNVCWLWTGATSDLRSNKYGIIRVKLARWYVGRVCPCAMMNKIDKMGNSQAVRSFTYVYVIISPTTLEFVYIATADVGFKLVDIKICLILVLKWCFDWFISNALVFAVVVPVNFLPPPPVIGLVTMLKIHVVHLRPITQQTHHFCSQIEYRIRFDSQSLYWIQALLHKFIKVIYGEI